jgi:hypothetical protein
MFEESLKDRDGSRQAIKVRHAWQITFLLLFGRLEMTLWGSRRNSTHSNRFKVPREVSTF